ncbi:hypothetical protein BY458DRAFT_534120 [Sporodiniella umbellata]|nr:hypothetical protein BY458DRAFT_534120 [Sporodiniella umbellata]
MTQATAPPVLPDHVKKPNEEEFKKNIEGINASIEKLQKQFDAIKEKIAKLPAKGDNSRREEIKSELSEIREKQAELKKSRRAVYEQLDALNDSIRKKLSAVKAFRSKVPFRNTEEVDDRIAELERKIEVGVRIVEEKKMLQEISLLKRNRLSFEDIDNQQKEIDRERAIHDELKKNIDESEAQKMSDRYEELDAEFKVIFGDQNKQREVRNKLFDERTRLKVLLDEEYTKLRTARDEHRKNNDEYYTFVRQLREFKKEQEQLRKVQEENDKRQEAAKQELELAALPAFENEIALCDNLSLFLEGFLSSGNKTNQTTGEDAGAIENAFEGMVIKKRDDDIFFAGGGKKKQNKNKENVKDSKKSDALKLPLATMEHFFDIKVTVPTKISEIPSTLQKLKERKEYFVREQPMATEANKKKAEERVQALMRAEEEAKETAANETKEEQV